jgi:hypothetical protein
MTPTGRTLHHLRAAGYVAESVERFIAQIKCRKDFLGCIDIIGVKASEPVLAVQATSAPNHASRVNKAKREPRLQTWLQSGSRFEIWSWAKCDGRWECRKTPLVLDDLDVLAIEPPRRRRRKIEPTLFAGAI